MNRKISTLLASFLLAGGVFSSAYASINEMKPGEYYKIQISNSSSQGYWLDGDAAAWYASSTDEDGSCYWTAEAVKESTTGTIVGYKLKNAKGKYYVVEDADGKYDTFTHTDAAKINEWWSLKVANKDLYAHEGKAVALANNACISIAFPRLSVVNKSRGSFITFS